jgi:hypothetical protein
MSELDHGIAETAPFDLDLNVRHAVPDDGDPS